MSENQAKPWERQEGEPHRWFQRFEAYRLMGPGRSLRSCYNTDRVAHGHEESRQASGTWRKIADLWSWQARAEAWDQEQTRLDQELWEKRRREQREEDWTTAAELRRAARIMLFEPGELSGKVSDIAKAVDVAAKVGRLATGEPTEHTQHSGQVSLSWADFVKSATGEADDQPEASPDEP